MPRKLGRSPSLPSTSRTAAPVRSSPRARGYDSRWDRESLAYRRAIGVCERCRTLGRIRSPRVTDHKWPVADGGPMFDRSNWWALCRPCHDWKASLEAFARRTGQVEHLAFWCDNPDELPARYKEGRL